MHVALGGGALHPVFESAVDAGDRHGVVIHGERGVLLDLVEHFYDGFWGHQVVTRESAAVPHDEAIRLRAPGEQLLRDDLSGAVGGSHSSTLEPDGLEQD